MIKRKSTSRKAPATRKTPRKAARKTAASGKAKSLPPAQESEVRYLHLFEAANDALFVGDAETGLLLDANRKACELVGRTRKELVGRPQSMLHPPEDAERYRAVFRDHVLNGDATTGNLVLAHASGRRIPVEISASVMDFGERKAVLGIFRDISARSRMEQALRESEEQFRNLADQSPNMIFLTQEGRVVYANAQCAKIMGYAREEFTAPGFDFMVLIVPEYREMIRENLERQARGLDVEPFEYALLTVDGRRLEAIINTRMIRYAGEPAILCVVTDITERKRMEEELRESEVRYRTIFENGPLGMAMVGMDDRFLKVNVRFSQMLGYAERELLYLNFRDVTHPDHLEADLENIRKVMRGDIPLYQAEKRYLRKHGEVLWGSLTLTLIRDKQGAPLFFQAMIEDITERKMAEEALEGSAQRLALHFQQTPLGVIEWNTAFEVTEWNPSAESIFGYSREEALGRHSSGLLVPESAREHVDRIWAALMARKGGARSTNENFTKDGRTILCEWYNTPLANAQEQVIGVASLVQDVTARRKAELELGRTYDRMRQTIRGTIHTISKIVESRDPFTAGHQLRVAELALEIARLMDLDPERRQGIHTAALIHDIGKIHVPAEILSKPGRLSEIEFEMIRTHSQFGFKILENIDFPWPVADIVLQHHERLDGSGYPNRLHREAILLDARIISVADVVEAMAMHRPYRPAPGLDRALDEIREHRGVLYDADVVEACLTLFFEKGFQFSTSTEPRDFSIV